MKHQPNIFPLIILFFLGLITSPTKASENSLPDAVEGKSVVYIWRNLNSVCPACNPALYIDGAEIESIYQGSYIITNLDPGSHVIEFNYGFFGARAPNIKKGIDTKAGQKYFYKYALTSDGSSIAFIPGAGPVPMNHFKSSLTEETEESTLNDCKSLKTPKELEAMWASWDNDPMDTE